MTTSTIVQRHYPKIDGLVARTASDIPTLALEGRANALAFLGELRDALPERPRLVSSAHGAIERILLSVPAYAVSPPSAGVANPLAEVYKDLLAKVPRRVAIVVMTHESVASEVEQWLKNAGLDANAILVAAPDHLHFSIWAEDGYVALEDEATTDHYLLEPYLFPRYGDALIADFVANQTDLKSNQAPLYFQGGNVLVGDDFFMIGADYPANSLGYVGNVIFPSAGESPVDAVRRLYGEYMDAGRQLIYVGSTIPVPEETSRSIVVGGQQWQEVLYFGNHAGTVQPLFHIDMFLTLAGRGEDGRYRVLVGDPGLAARELGAPPWPHAMQEVFDNIARGLERRGFAVVRNPLPLIYVDDASRRERVWYFATANNALVEIDGDERKVWLPTYGHGNWAGLAVTDASNRAIWESLGFTVEMLGDFHPFAENLGAVHCIKKYLGRS